MATECPAVNPSPILVRFQHVYGKPTCYPANQQAEVLARLCGTKTLTPQALAGARALGLVVTGVAAESEAALGDFLAGVTP